MQNITHNNLLNILNCVLSRYVNMFLCKTTSLQRKHSLNGYLFTFFSHTTTLRAVLQIGRSLVRFQVVSLGFFIDTILPIALWPWG